MGFKVPQVRKMAQILFHIAIFVIPFQIFTIIWQPDISFSGHANQFNNASIYLTDILIIISAILFFPSKFHKKISFGKKPIFISLILLTVLIIILNNIFPTEWLVWKLAILWITYILIINKITSKESIGNTLLTAAALQAFLAITQFFIQKNVGLNILGEPNFLADGIAKIDIGTEKFIRSYGTMPHPNILAGFLLMTLFLGKNKILKIICIIGLVLTFSRSAILATIICGLVYLTFNFKNTTSCLKNKKIFLIGILLTITTLSVLAYPQIKSRLLSTTEMEERLMILAPTIEMIKDNPLGIGLGNFTNKIQKYTEIKLAPWEYQPIHNVYLLATAELSIIGTGLILFIIIYSLFIAKDKKIKYAIFTFTLIGFFDHYQYTLYQGEMMSVVLISLASAYHLHRAKTPKPTSPVSPLA